MNSITLPRFSLFKKLQLAAVVLLLSLIVIGMATPALAVSDVETINAGSMVIILVEQGVSGLLGPELSIYSSDIQREYGFRTDIRIVHPSETAANLKDYIVNQYQRNALAGVLIVGNVPTGNFYSPSSVPDPIFDSEGDIQSDSIYQDVSSACSYHTDTNRYTSENTNCPIHGILIARPYWVGRITPNSSTQSNISLLKDYFHRNHAYRMGAFSYQKNVLLYVPLTEATGDEIDTLRGSFLFNVYTPNQINVVDRASTTSDWTYLNELNKLHQYEIVYYNGHGSPRFKQKDIDSLEIQNASVFLGYFASCSVGRFTTRDYLAGQYLFSNSLVVIAPTTPVFGSSEAPVDFIHMLTSGQPIFEALKVMPLGGSNLLGDPTLRMRYQVASVPASKAVIAIDKSQIVLSDADEEFRLTIRNDGNSQLLYKDKIFMFDAQVDARALPKFSIASSEGPPMLDPQTSKMLTFRSYPWSDVVVGTHTGTFFILSNDPVRPILKIPFTIQKKATTTTPAPTCGTLPSGATLIKGQNIYSCDTNYRINVQTDGNVVLYTKSGRAVWSTRTSGRTITAFRMQADGNLVLYNGATALWSSRTPGITVQGLTVNNNGTLSLTAVNGTVLWSNTNNTISTPTSTPPTTTTSTPLGYLDGNCSSFWGWAYDPDAPAASIIVRIEDEKGTIYSSVANAVHTSINTSRNLTGNHGIYHPFPASLKDGVAHTFRAYGVDTTTGAKVAFVQPPKTMTCVAPVPTTPNITAGLVTIPATVIAGTPITLSSAITNSGSATTGGFPVIFFVYSQPASGGGTLINLPGQGSPALGAGATRTITQSHTFATAGAYSVRLCVNKLGQYTSTPESNNCGPWKDVAVRADPSSSTTTTTTLNILPKGNVEASNCTFFQGWTYDPNASSTSIGVVVKEGETTRLTGTANLIRSDVNTQRGITGNHGFSILTPASLKDGITHTLRVYGVDTDGTSLGELFSNPRTVTCAATTTATTTAQVQILNQMASVLLGLQALLKNWTFGR